MEKLGGTLSRTFEYHKLLSKIHEQMETHFVQNFAWKNSLLEDKRFVSVDETLSVTLRGENRCYQGIRTRSFPSVSVGQPEPGRILQVFEQRTNVQGS